MNSNSKVLRIALYIFLSSLLVIISVGYSNAQADSLFRNLDSVTISAGRIQSPYLSVPGSVSLIDLSVRSSYLDHSDLSEAVSGVPGIFTLNGQNFAQDLRISLRGFGARSAFGIRGIKLIVDGVPETTPDGQGQLDNIAVGDISTIEVLQGTSAAQYGNASGGVLEINTLDINEAPYYNLNIRVGSFGMRQYQFKTAQQFGKSKLEFSGNHQQSEGYRSHSRLKQSNFLVKLSRQWKNTELKWQFSYLTSPQAEDPGGINLNDATANPRAARDRNISFNAGEEINHLKSSIILNHKLSANLEWSNVIFYSTRSFDGRLPFSNGGAINLDRTYGGWLTQLKLKNIYNEWIHDLNVGTDMLIQRDERDRFVNNEGVRGDQTLGQEEQFDNLGIYMIDQWSREGWILRGALRYDFHRLGVDDFFLTDGDQSGSRNLTAFNYNFGVTHRYNPQHSLFINWSTSYETPTLSELSSNPQGGGFNPEVLPMSAVTIEVGGKGRIKKDVDYSLSIFRIKTKDELIPFELADFPGRTFFRNAGKTDRLGIEGKIDYHLSSSVQYSSAYSFSNFSFDEYIVDGKDLQDLPLPGIPQHSWTNTLTYSKKPVYLRVSSRYFSEISVRDDQSVTVAPYHLVSLRMGGHLIANQVRINPFIGVNNLFSTRYFDNLRVNAFGGRYYEPGASINWQMGCGIEF